MYNPCGLLFNGSGQHDMQTYGVDWTELIHFTVHVIPAQPESPYELIFHGLCQPSTTHLPPLLLSNMRLKKQKRSE